MILNTGSRTDIPAYYAPWFYNRIREGYVLARNPYYPSQVTRYRLTPKVIDILTFCTKNPQPILDRLQELSEYCCVWYVTITCYGRDVEPFVPETGQVMDSFKRLSALVGKERVIWRYDPVFLSDIYPEEYHVQQFGWMADSLSRYTDRCVVSFIDLYEKTKRNFPGIREVAWEEQKRLIKAFSRIAARNHIKIHLCCEKKELETDHVDAKGCMTKEVLEQAAGFSLNVPKKRPARPECGCLLGADIGAYNTCGHGCLYCYANYDRKTVARNMKNHNLDSPFLIGGFQEGDIIKEAVQTPWRDGQLSLSGLYPEAL